MTDLDLVRARFVSPIVRRGLMVLIRGLVGPLRFLIEVEIFSPDDGPIWMPARHTGDSLDHRPDEYPSGILSTCAT